jgi:hypothetical protein
VIVASYERDLANLASVSSLACRKIHRNHNTGNHYSAAPRITAQPTEPQVIEATRSAP